MSNPRFLTAAGSAVAASIGIGAFLWISPRHSVVEASTILRSFRQTLFDGFQLSMRDVGADGVRVNGDFSVRFKPRGAGAPGGAIDPADLEPEALSFELTVQADANAEPDVRGLDVALAGSFSDPAQWVFLRVEQLPEELIADEPLALAFLPMLQNGVMLKLDGLEDIWKEHIPDLFGEDDDQDEVSAKDEVRVNVDVQADAGAPHAAHVIELDGHGTIDLDDSQADAMEKLVEDLLYGRAGPEHLEQLVTLIEQAARHAEVVKLGDGLFRLTASDFTRETDASDDDYQMLQKMIINITYRQGSGVESADLRNVGDYGGVIAFGPLSDRGVGVALDPARYLDGGTMMLDLGSFGPMVEQLMKSQAE